MTLENFHSPHTSARANNFKAMKQMFTTVACISAVLKFQCCINKAKKNFDQKILLL